MGIPAVLKAIDEAIKRLLDLRTLDFRERHIFTSKLRLVIFVGFWALVIAYFQEWLWADPPIMLWITLTFVATTIFYLLVLNKILPYFFFVFELMADVAAHTLLIHFTGGVSSGLYILYIVYSISGSLYYSWRVALLISFLAVSFYSVLLAGYQWGGWEPYQYQEAFQGIALLSEPGAAWISNLLLLLSFLAVAIYGTHIANHFTKQRERALEARNRELSALNRIASTIRSAISLDRVIHEVLSNLNFALGYRAAFILLVNEETEKIQMVAQSGRRTDEVADLLQFSLNDLYLPRGETRNPIYQAMKKHKRILRKELSEAVIGTVPRISPHRAREIQDLLGVHKIIAVPLIAERKLVGALVGMSAQEWLSDDQIASFERYADQAALALDNAALIEKLRRKNVELERVSRVKSEFLATMSHELRTPLTAIIGFSELLLEEVLGELADDQKESLLEVLNNAESLLQLINSLLDLSKIEAGKMDMTMGPIDVADLVHRIERTVQALLHKKEHQLQVEIPSDLPILYADERKLQQVLLNLTSNAIKFTKHGGKIAIRAHYLKDVKQASRWGEVSPRFYREGAFEIEVADNGIGIEEKDLEVIFESFRQVDSSFTRSYQGTGLGLALTQQFVEMHHGKIQAESRYGKGSVFRILVPRGEIVS